MTAPLQLYLVRHGETAWSLTGQQTGRTDLGLTADGEDQARARALAPRLREIEFDRVLVSPRLRARQTRELAGLGARSLIEPDLAEWDYGDYEGQRSADIRKEHADWNVWRDGCPTVSRPTSCRPMSTVSSGGCASCAATSLFSRTASWVRPWRRDGSGCH